jgi:hypothetical protein
MYVISFFTGGRMMDIRKSSLFYLMELSQTIFVALLFFEIDKCSSLFKCNYILLSHHLIVRFKMSSSIFHVF